MYNIYICIDKILMMCIIIVYLYKNIISKTMKLKIIVVILTLLFISLQ